jgi:hypothetical protein
VKRFFIFVLSAFTFYGCSSEKELPEEIKTKETVKEEAVIKQQENRFEGLFKEIFSSKIEKVKKILSREKCKNFSYRQYGNTDEHYLECSREDIDLMLMYNGSTGEVVEITVFPKKNTDKILEEIKKAGFNTEIIKSKDNPSKNIGIIVRPADYEGRYQRMIEGI